MMDMSGRVADQFAGTLAAAGVKRVYGIVGDSPNGPTDTMRRQDKIEGLQVRHEEVAAFTAGAEAHLTGEPAVCAGSCGPGNLHLINGLFDRCSPRNALCEAAIAHNNDRYPLGGEDAECFLLGHHACFTTVCDAARYGALPPPKSDFMSARTSCHVQIVELSCL